MTTDKTAKTEELETILDEDDSDADHLPQLDAEETEAQASVAVAQPVKTSKRTAKKSEAKTESAKTEPTTYGAGDLAKLLKLEPKSTRAELRKLAKTDESPLLRVRPGSGYSWSKRELESVAKKVAKSIDAAAAQKSQKQ
jgi:hypothetical protein